MGGHGGRASGVRQLKGPRVKSSDERAKAHPPFVLDNDGGPTRLGGQRATHSYFARLGRIGGLPCAGRKSLMIKPNEPQTRFALIINVETQESTG